MINVGIVSTYPPTQCGIATFTSDLIGSMALLPKAPRVTKVELSHILAESNAFEPVIENTNREHFIKAADFINIHVDILHIQHEFKIFGGPDGENIKLFLDLIKKPIIATLHTVSQNANEARVQIVRAIVERCEMINIFSEESRRILIDTFGGKLERIHVMPHGVPAIEFKEPGEISARKKFSAPLMFVSAGHMRKAKGYEIALWALYSVKDEFSDFHYLILGSNHPQDKAASQYRQELGSLVGDLGLSRHVTFINDYLDSERLISFIQTADVGLLPYNREEQSSSGILAIMLACGRPIVSTPFQFAKALVSEDSGVLSTSFDNLDFATAIRTLLQKQHRWRSMSEYNYKLAQKWTWKKIAEMQYLQYIHLARKLEI